ncbi:hypothetical protein DFH27DRAFT_488009 [Peziza echinospora]|nr:hypothetical protein DFH27DRAFT_488009 [Peziza echinospora]
MICIVLCAAKAFGLTRAANFYLKNRISTSRWPGKSPDLIAIENVWSKLKSLLKRMYLLAEKKHKPIRSQNDFIKAAQEEWELTDWNKVDNMIVGMPRRIKAVVDGNGMRTKY